jgi:hypothetical protein
MVHRLGNGILGQIPACFRRFMTDYLAEYHNRGFLGQDMGGIAENLPFWCVEADPAKTLLVSAI